MPRQLPVETEVGVLRAYYRGDRIRDICAQWSVSYGYVYKLLRRLGMTKRGWSPSKRATEPPPRRLIPYAGKEPK